MCCSPGLLAKQVHITPSCSFLGWISSLTCTGTSPPVISSCTPSTSTSPAILSHSTPMGFVPWQPNALCACCTAQGCHQTWLQLLLARVPGELNTLFGNCSLKCCREATLPCTNEDGIHPGHRTCALSQQAQTYLTPPPALRSSTAGDVQWVGTNPAP